MQSREFIPHIDIVLKGISLKLFLDMVSSSLESVLRGCFFEDETQRVGCPRV